MRFELRPYQRDAINAVIRSKKRSVAIALPTGAGKTAVAVGLFERYRPHGWKMLFVVPSIELMRQAGGAFGVENYLGGGCKPDWDAPILISTIQSLSRNMGQVCRSHFNFLMIDEAHHAVAKSFGALTASRQWGKICSLSATMFRSDGKRLADVVEEVVFERDLHWAIEEGYLTPYRLLRPRDAHRLPLTTETVQAQYEDGSVREMERASFDHSERNQMVAELVAKIMADEGLQSGIMFVNTIEHARVMAEALTAAAPKQKPWGWCSGTERSGLEDFKEGNLRGIVSVQLVLEGFDMPVCDFLCVNGNIRADSTGLIRWAQLLGRVLRLHPGKTQAVALDLSVRGLPDVQYKSNLEGSDQVDEEAEALERAQLTILERLEHPMLLRIEDLVRGLRQINNEYRRRQEQLDTSLCLEPGADGAYAVVDANGWRVRQVDAGWEATDGFQRLQAATLRELEPTIKGRVFQCGEGKPTEKQIKLLKRWKVKKATIQAMTRQQASDYISQKMGKQNAEPATSGQLWILRNRFGYSHEETDGISKRQAMRLIGAAQREERTA